MVFMDFNVIFFIVCLCKLDNLMNVTSLLMLPYIEFRDSFFIIYINAALFKFSKFASC